MLIYNKAELTKQAKEYQVVRDTFEKVCRLKEILRFFDSSPVIRDNIALKGGTAINLLFFDLPRLSVDIDLDMCKNVSREKMTEIRGIIKEQIYKYMIAEGYVLSPKSKSPHSLDSFVYSYINSAGIKDNIKIEINYSLRSHVFKPQRVKIQSDIFKDDFEVNTLSPIEIYASKTVALMTRAAARDLYDMNYKIMFSPFKEDELELYRKTVIFYLAIATESPITMIDLRAIDSITAHKITTDLKPVVRDKDAFELNSAKEIVTSFIKNNIFIKETELEFLQNFKRGIYTPELLFDGDMLDRVLNHPMAIWKINKNKQKEIER